AARVRDSANAGRFRFAPRLWQRSESAAGALQRTAPRDFAPAGVGRDARQRPATFCFRKRAHQSAGRSSRRGPGVATGAARAETDSELSPDRPGKRERSLRAGALVHDWAFARDGIRDGSLCGIAKLTYG